MAWSARPLGGGGLHPHGLNLYSEPGTWTLDYIAVCDEFRHCAVTSGSALASLVSPLTISVVNTVAPASRRPVVTSAAVLTPTLQQTSPFTNLYIVSPFQVAVTAKGTAPGIVQAEATFTPPANRAVRGPEHPADEPQGADALGARHIVLRDPIQQPAQLLQYATSLPGVYTLNRADRRGSGGQCSRHHRSR